MINLYNHECYYSFRAGFGVNKLLLAWHLSPLTSLLVKAAIKFVKKSHERAVLGINKDVFLQLSWARVDIYPIALIYHCLQSPEMIRLHLV